MENGIEVQEFIDHFNEFADNSDDARRNCERDRDYYDHKQLTSEEANELKKRGQPPVTYNRIQPKIMFMLGAERQTRTDPKAFPRTPKHEQAADAVTDALRYIADNVNFDVISSNVFENECVEGTGGAITEWDTNKKEIVVKRIPWDRLYWDVHSRELDFADCSRFGIVIWMDFEEAKRRWPNATEAIQLVIGEESQYEGYDDAPRNKRWLDKQRKRLMVMQEYYKKGGRWYECYFCKGGFLKSPIVSPYLDEDGVPCCPIELQSAFTDRDGYRYGVVRAYIDAQDEINKRRSKALHLLNSNQTMAEEGAVANVNKFKAEKNKPNGHMVINSGMMEKVKFIDQQPELLAHLQFMIEAKNEIDAIGVNPALSGKQDGSPSGRALQARQQGGMTELGPVFDRHRMWKKRMVRQFWARVKQFWDEEKWIRVTDDAEKMKFVGLNIPITQGQIMEEMAQKTGQEIPPHIKADPRMNQVVGKQNDVAEIDVDIILEESPDFVTLQHEIFENVMNAVSASGQPLPLEVLIDLMPAVPNKRALLDKLKGDPQVQEQNAAKQKMIEELQMRGAVAEVANTEAETAKKQAETEDEKASAFERMARIRLDAAKLSQPQQATA